MSKSLNRVELIGHLGQVPDIKLTKGGLQVANVSIATSHSVKSGEGYKDTTEWHKLTFFGKLVGVVDKYLDKGSHIYVSGRLSTNKWQDKNGVDRWTTSVIVDNLIMLGGGERGGVRSSSEPEPYQQQSDGGLNDDVPF